MEVRHIDLSGHAFTSSMLYKLPHCTISHSPDNGKVLRSTFYPARPTKARSPTLPGIFGKNQGVETPVLPTP